MISSVTDIESKKNLMSVFESHVTCSVLVGKFCHPNMEIFHIDLMIYLVVCEYFVLLFRMEVVLQAALDMSEVPEVCFIHDIVNISTFTLYLLNDYHEIEISFITITISPLSSRARGSYTPIKF